MGVSDIAHEPKFCFFNYLLPSPQPSLLLRKQYLSLREQSLSHRDWNSSRSERGGILAVFPVFSSLHKRTEKCDSTRF